MSSSGRGTLQSVEDLKDLFAQLSGEFGYLLIDAPGVNVCGDATILGQAADAVVLVIEADVTRRQSARKAKETLESAGVQILGTVLRNRSFPIPDALFRRL